MIFLSTAACDAASLKDCVSLALQNSQLITAYENQVRAHVEAYRKSLSVLLPQTQISVGGDQVWFGRASGLAHRHGNEGHLGATASLALQKLISLAPRLNRMEIEKSRLLQTIARQTLKKDVTQEYDKLYVLLKKKREYVQMQSYFSAHVQDIEKLQAHGVDVKLDLGRSHVQQKSLFISLNNVTAAIHNLLVSLGARMNAELKESDFYSMTEPDLSAIKTKAPILDETSTEEDDAGSEIERIEADYEKKIPKLVQTRLAAEDVKLAGEAYRQSKFYYIPTLDFAADRNIHTTDPSTDAYKLALSVSLNPFEFPQKEFERRQLKYEYEHQKHLFEDNQIKLKVQISQLITDIENVQTTYKNASENLKTAAQNIETAKTYYQQGKIKETDLLNVFSEYLTAQEQAYQSLEDYLMKKADLDFILEGTET